ncbi:MAG: hypothetical protein H6636_06710 [Anaerolineales bacterium]|nr:hypothetical protein [Anaerolineales bacterium]
MKRTLKLMVGVLAFWGLVTVAVQAEGGGYLMSLPLITRGPTWDEVGASSASGGGISNSLTYYGVETPVMAIAPDGMPYVVWTGKSEQDLSRPGEIYVQAWDGSSWGEVGEGSASGEGISQGGELSIFPSIAIAPDGTVYVAWGELLDNGFSAQIYIKAWDGENWLEVGEGSASGNGISQAFYSTFPSVAIAPDGTPYVAWQDADPWGSSSSIFVRAWNGSHWVDVGEGLVTIGGISGEAPSLAFAPDGTLYLAWRSTNSIYVLAWNGTDWGEVGAGSASGGGISNDFWYSGDPSLAIAPDGTPYVAWERTNGIGSSRAIFIRRWKGNIWEEVGLGSATGAGISNASGVFGLPGLAVAPDNMPYLVWSDESSGNLEIYIRTWNGTAWIEVGDGSASGGGISNNPGISKTPVIAVSPDGKFYVTWPDDSDGNWQIYVRQYVK